MLGEIFYKGLPGFLSQLSKFAFLRLLLLGGQLLFELCSGFDALSRLTIGNVQGFGQLREALVDVCLHKRIGRNENLRQMIRTVIEVDQCSRTLTKIGNLLGKENW